MRSLFCVTHPDWDTTISEIVEKGGKVGKAWIENKKRSGFAFSAMCWEKSFIPLEIWKAGDANTNIVESVHSNINLEGVRCTLLGGIMKAEIYDWNKMEALKNKEKSGIRLSYQQQHPFENAERMLKCKFAVHHQQIMAADMKIVAAEDKILKAEEEVRKRQKKLDNLLAQPQSSHLTRDSAKFSQKVNTSRKSPSTAKRKLQENIRRAQSLSPGSGKVKVGSHQSHT
ncbi:hypothetical protein H1R20_g6738, partial [Candolleomyces eurysporus]